jgi:hypothetical protein
MCLFVLVYSRKEGPSQFGVFGFLVSKTTARMTTLDFTNPASITMGKGSS